MAPGGSLSSPSRSSPILRIQFTESENVLPLEPAYCLTASSMSSSKRMDIGLRRSGLFGTEGV